MAFPSLLSFLTWNSLQYARVRRSNSSGIAEFDAMRLGHFCAFPPQMRGYARLCTLPEMILTDYELLAEAIADVTLNAIKRLTTPYFSCLCLMALNSHAAVIIASPIVSGCLPESGRRHGDRHTIHMSAQSALLIEKRQSDGRESRAPRDHSEART